ncbi:uncharacterized protein LOC142571378 isoform X2 [Dermacentor variabilis]|uniref:uncharacterized protein LOC142571378 isoform X2 n=1 Tax=Dermacentor variabilis TaxID=34621 RepID=UPI003F5AE936
MAKNQNTLACYLDKKTSMDNPGRAFLSTQSTAKSDSNTGHHNIGTGGCVFRRRSALDTICETRLYHCSAAEIAFTSGFATAVSQHVGDNAYEIIGPDHESPQGANNISVAEVSPIPLGSYHDR